MAFPPIPAVSILATTIAASMLPAQRVVATFQLDGRSEEITRSQLAVELAFHYRGRSRGKEARQQLVTIAIVRAEAQKAGLAPAQAEVDAQWQRVVRGLQAQGSDLDTWLAQRGTTREDFREFVELSIAQARLTAKAVGIPEDRITGEMQQLWLKDVTKTHQVVTEPDRLPATAVAKVDDTMIGLQTFGLYLLRTHSQAQQERFAQQIAARKIIQSRADRAGIRLTSEDLNGAVEQRRRRTKEDPRYHGVPFEELLKTQGFTIATLKASPVFRANVLLRKLVDQDNTPEKLARRIADDRGAVEASFGAQRKLGIILLRAKETPNALVRRTFAEAAAEMADLQRGIAEGAKFETVATLHSEDPTSKVRDGVVGWLPKVNERLSKTVMEAAFDAPIGGLTPVVRDEDGIYLIKVLDAEAPPRDAVLMERMKRRAVDEMTTDILDDAKLEFASR